MGTLKGSMRLWEDPLNFCIRVSPCDLEQVIWSVSMCCSKELHKGCNTTLNCALRQRLCCCHWGNPSIAPAWTVLVAAQLKHDVQGFLFWNRMVVMVT